VQLAAPDNFPTTGGQILFVPQNQIQTYFPLDADTSIFNYNTRLTYKDTIYTYTSRVGNELQNITPNLPNLASTNTFNLVSANRDASNTITAITSTPHNFNVNDYAIIDGATQGIGTGISTNGTWKITEITSTTEFKAYSFSGPSGARASTGGTVRVEKEGVSSNGGLMILRSSMLDEQVVGPYLWDTSADFVLSSLTTTLTSEITAGTTQRSIQVNANDIPNEEGKLIFDFGTEFQEGPVRYLFKPSSSTLALDPSYVFQYNHDIGSSVTKIRRRGGIQFDGRGSEYAPYITDPSAARQILQELMQELKSVGVFINFLVRYPELFYATLDVYQSGVDPG
jgi:hypothetical protein